MASRLQKLKRNAFLEQKGRCWYCDRQMLLCPETSSLQCTAEHLVARSQGGKDTPDNIVAACRYCNQTRHRRRMPPSPGDFRRIVRERLDKGRWHVRAAVQKCVPQ